MKKTRILRTAAAFLAAVLLYPAPVYAISARKAILMDGQTGRILYEKQANDRSLIASTTKIMTSLIALEAGVPNKEITVTKEMVAVEGTSMGLLEGDKVSMKELVYGMLLQSGNDAANTVATVIGGSPEGFAILMNERAKEIGMKMVLRTMSPEIIAVDEIGKEEEFVLLEQMRCSGVKILGTMHAGSMEELLRNPMIRDCINTGAIERFVELIRLDNGQRKYRIYDGQGTLLWGK